MSDQDSIIKRMANERIRVAADQWSRSYWLAKRIVQEWEAGGFAVLIPDSPDFIIPDGSDSDGRQSMSGQHCWDILRTCYIIIGFCETVNSTDFGGRKPLLAITRVAVNGALG